MSTIKLISLQNTYCLFDEYTFVSKEVGSADTEIEKYCRDGMFYTLTIAKRDGVKDGEAKMVDLNGILIAELTFKDGKHTGHCKLYRTNGILQFDGNLENGEKSGHCTEYDENGKEIFEGYYRGGERIPYFEEVSDKPGYYIERSRENLNAIAYTEYNPQTKEKNGTCFVLNSAGCVEKEVNMRKNKQIDMRRIFTENEMTEYNDRGMVVYQGGYKGDWKSGFKRNGSGIEYDGSSKDTSKCKQLYRGDFVDGKHIFHYVEIKRGHLHGYYKETKREGGLVSISQMKYGSLIKHGRSIEFSPNDGKPTSEKEYIDGEVVYERIQVEGNQMKEYDEGGNRVYQGSFMYVNGKFIRWGKGTEYDGKNMIKYNGEFANGYYHGEGILYCNGHAYYNGNWKYGYPTGRGLLYDENDRVHSEGNWHLGYLKGMDYLKGGKSTLNSCQSAYRARNVYDRMQTLHSYCKLFSSKQKGRRTSMDEIAGHGFNTEVNYLDIESGALKLCFGENVTRFRVLREWYYSLTLFERLCVRLIVLVTLILLCYLFTHLILSLVFIARIVRGEGILVVNNCVEYHFLNWFVAFYIKNLEFANGCCSLTSNLELRSRVKIEMIIMIIMIRSSRVRACYFWGILFPSLSSCCV